jgi:hypothetical protein
LLLIELNDVHLGLLPNELAGVHEGAVPPMNQAKSMRQLIHRISCGGCGEQSLQGSQPHKIGCKWA